MPPNAEEWEKGNVSASSLDPQLSVARRTSSCNNCIGRTVSFREGSFCDPVEIVMCDLKEQRTCLKFCFLLGKTPTESLEMLQEAFKEQALSRAWVFEWFSRFKKGDLSIEDQPRSGRPSSSRNDENIAKIREKLNEDRRHTIDELSEVTGVSWSSVQRILTQDLGMRRVAAKFVPRLLTEDQRNSRLTVCQDLKRELENDPNFLSRVITGDESWCYGYDPESKQASSQWKTPASPRPKKIRQVRSNVKTMLICFFDIQGIVHREFVPRGQTVNQEFYLGVLKRLRERVRRTRPELWRSGEWLIHHDNAPAHTALRIRQFLTSHGMTLVPHPPYSPDLAPADFFLFPRMKRDLKGRRFDTVEDVIAASTGALNSIQVEEFQRCFEQWKQRLDKCISSNGEYFEGD